MINALYKDPLQLTDNFHVDRDHMRCPCCQGLEVNFVFLRKAQILRTEVGVPFVLPLEGGFYRCALYNSTLPNGAKDSRHLYGSAMDISRRDWDGTVRWKFLSWATKLGLSVGTFDTYYHIDLRSGSPVQFP